MEYLNNLNVVISSQKRGGKIFHLESTFHHTQIKLHETFTARFYTALKCKIQHFFLLHQHRIFLFSLYIVKKVCVSSLCVMFSRLYSVTFIPAQDAGSMFLAPNNSFQSALVSGMTTLKRTKNRRGSALPNAKKMYEEVSKVCFVVQ